MTDNKCNEVDFTSEKTDLFVEKGMDEMLRYKNYELGYRLFKKYFTAIYTLSAVLAAAGGFLRDVPLSAAGILIMAISVVLRIMYASKAAAQGIMNPIFAKRIAVKMGKAYLSLPVSNTVMSVFGIISAIESGKPHYLPFWMLMLLGCVTAFSEYFFAKKNLQVLEKMLKENEEEAEE